MNITGCSIGCSVRSFFVCKRFLESNGRTANIFFLGKIIVFISLSRDKETNQMKTCFAARNSKFFLLAPRASRKARTKNIARHKGLHPLCIPAASRANAAAPRRLIRTRLSDSKNFAFAASKRTAKNETLTTTESKNFFSSARRKPEQRAPRERGYVIYFMFHENILLFSIVNQKTL